MGVKVKIMKPHEPSGKFGGVKHPLPDKVDIRLPNEKDED